MNRFRIRIVAALCAGIVSFTLLDAIALIAAMSNPTVAPVNAGAANPRSTG